MTKKEQKIHDKAVKETTKKFYPVFDRLQEEFENGSYISIEGGLCVLFNGNDVDILSGKTFREICVNYILENC